MARGSSRCAHQIGFCTLGKPEPIASDVSGHRNLVAAAPGEPVGDPGEPVGQRARPTCQALAKIGCAGARGWEVIDRL